MSNRTKAIRFFRHWHARIGVLGALFFLLLAVTGIALNHTHQLELDKHHTSAPWLMRWYGLRPDQDISIWPAGNGLVAASKELWVMDGKKLAEKRPLPVGVIEFSGVRYVATHDAIALYLPDGRLVERLGAASLPGNPLRRIGQAGRELVVETGAGVYAADETLVWHKRVAQGIQWSQSRRPNADELSQLTEVLAPRLPMERVLLDIHSGRILGRYGSLVMDVAAMILLMLALSGIWIYFRSIGKRHS